MAKNITIAKLNTLITANSIQFKNELSKASGVAVAFGDKMNAMSKTVAKFGLGVALAAATGVVALAKSVSDLSSRIVDLSSVAGMSTDTFQRISAVAMDSGVSMEEVAKASDNMRDGLEDASKKGSDPLNASLEKLHLTADGLKGLAPEEQWAVIAQRVGEAADKQEALNAVSDLFGSKLGPKMRQTLEEIAKGAETLNKQPIIDKETLAVIDEAGDKWNKMWLKVQVGASKAFNLIHNGVAKIAKGVEEDGLWWMDGTKTPGADGKPKRDTTKTAFPEVDEQHVRDAAAKLEIRMKDAEAEALRKNPFKVIEDENEQRKKIDDSLNAFFDPLDAKSKESRFKAPVGLDLSPTDALSRIGLQTGVVPPEQKKQTDLLSQISKLLSSIDKGVRSPSPATFSN
jgi:hypothetical protein